MPVGTASWPMDECMPRSLPASASLRACSSKRRMVTIVSYIQRRVFLSIVELVVANCFLLFVQRPTLAVSIPLAIPWSPPWCQSPCPANAGNVRPLGGLVNTSRDRGRAHSRMPQRIRNRDRSGGRVRRGRRPLWLWLSEPRLSVRSASRRGAWPCARPRPPAGESGEGRAFFGWVLARIHRRTPMDGVRKAEGG